MQRTSSGKPEEFLGNCPPQNVACGKSSHGFTKGFYHIMAEKTQLMDNNYKNTIFFSQSPSVTCHQVPGAVFGEESLLDSTYVSTSSPHVHY